MLMLRPHHLLCTKFFEGKGYSDSFTENMYKVISYLETDSEIKLITKRDIICSECPEKCTSGKALDYDRKVLEYCKLDENKIYRYNQLRNTVKSGILEKNLLSEVCGDCQWYRICSKTKTDGK